MNDNCCGNEIIKTSHLQTNILSEKENSGLRHMESFILGITQTQNFILLFTLLFLFTIS